MEYLEELERKYEELGKEIERIKKAKNKRWRAEESEEYYCVNINGKIKYFTENNDAVDDYYYKIRNYFKTREEAQRHLDNINTYYELVDLAEELNDGVEIDWENDKQTKYYIYFNCSYKKLMTGNCYSIKRIAEIYCIDENFLEKAKERIGEERLINLFKGE